MLPNGNPIVLALATAYCALAAPTNPHTDHIREVIDALKVHLEADNVNDAAQVIDEAEATLRAGNTLNKNVAADLKNQIQTLTTEEGISIDTIVQETIKFLNAKGALKKPEQDGVEDGPIVLDADVIEEVLNHGVNFIQLDKRGPCPDGSQADLCCIIL